MPSTQVPSSKPGDGGRILAAYASPPSWWLNRILLPVAGRPCRRAEPPAPRRRSRNPADGLADVAEVPELQALDLATIGVMAKIPAEAAIETNPATTASSSRRRPGRPR